MRVSVVIPTYNRRRYIGETVASALAQDYDDMEVIVVDDGSTDGTEDALAPFRSRIRYIRTENGGPAAARNAGMQAARGEYIANLDDDDLYYPFKIRLQAKLLDERPDIGLVWSEFSAFDDDGFWDEFHMRTYHASAYARGGLTYDSLFEERRPLQDLIADDAALQEHLQPWQSRSLYVGHIHDAYLFNTVVFTNSMMFRRDLLARAGLQQSRFRMFHDLEFALRLCKHAKAAFIDVPTYKLRYHPQQISTTQTPDGERVAIKIQRDLLRVTRYHTQRDREYYARNKPRVDRQLARLCRAVAVPLLSYDDGRSETFKRYSKRARRYLRTCAVYGRPEPLLLALTYAPHLVRRVVFRLLAVRASVAQRLKQAFS